MQTRLFFGIFLTSGFIWNGSASAAAPNVDGVTLNPQVEAEGFEVTLRLARKSMATAREIKTDLGDGTRPPSERDRLLLDFANELDVAARNFERALSLVSDRDDQSEVMTVYLQYAHVEYLQRKWYEAAVLAEHAARNLDRRDPKALDAAYLAIAAYVQAFNNDKSPHDRKSEDMGFVVKACKLVTDRWPGSEKATDACLIVGRMYSNQANPVDAATWFAKVAPDDSRYAVAQIAAGQAYRIAYHKSGQWKGRRPSPEHLAEWLNASQKHLLLGIGKLADEFSENEMPSADLIGAKATLATILIIRGREADALSVLVEGPHSVIKSVTVGGESKRSQNGITSRRFASEVFKMVLRCHLGLQDRDQAQTAMDKLLDIDAGGEGTDPYAAVEDYLKLELERLRDNGEVVRFEALKTQVEQFTRTFPQSRE